MSQPGLESLSLNFNGSARDVEGLGILRVQRMNDDDQRKVVVRITDPDGNPLSGANVTFNPFGQTGNSVSIPPVTTDSEGKAELKLYPHKYQCHASLAGYNPVTQMVQFSTGDPQAQPIDVTLHRAIRASIRVVWRARLGNHPGMPQFGNDAITNGEFEQHAGAEGAQAPAGPFGPHWVRLTQTDDAMQLQFINHAPFMGFRGASSESAWVGRLKSASEESDASSRETFDVKVAAELFDVIGLEELDAVAQEFKIERTPLGEVPGQGGPASLEVEAGDIFFGRINGRDMQMGRPATIEFKVLVTDLVRP